MLTNSKLTVYHKITDKHKAKWLRYNYDEVWFFGGKGSSTNKGYENANDCQVRIPYFQNQNLDISNFKIGDILVPQELKIDIDSETNLQEYGYFNITAITNNQYGLNKHIHLSGK